MMLRGLCIVVVKHAECVAPSCCSGPLNVAIKVLCLLPLLGEAFGRTKFHAQSLAQRRYGKPKSYFVHRCLETCLSILGRPNLHDLHGFALEHCFDCSHSLES